MRFVQHHLSGRRNKRALIDLWHNSLLFLEQRFSLSIWWSARINFLKIDCDCFSKWISVITQPSTTRRSTEFMTRLATMAKVLYFVSINRDMSLDKISNLCHLFCQRTLRLQKWNLANLVPGYPDAIRVLKLWPERFREVTIHISTKATVRSTLVVFM